MAEKLTAVMGIVGAVGKIHLTSGNFLAVCQPSASQALRPRVGFINGTESRP